MKLQLTKRAIDQAAYQGPGGCYFWDAELRGFGLRIYPSGRKSFLLTYSHKGRQRFFTLGRFGALTLVNCLLLRHKSAVGAGGGAGW